jgi:NAD(P)-dependent dehydrogenase (short-subunit alcohol dehydrogenase family)
MPGAFLTDISQAWSKPMLEGIAAQTPLRRAGEPAEIVGAALYLASGASSYTTGSILKVDGGAAWQPG